MEILQRLCLKWGIEYSITFTGMMKNEEWKIENGE
jgi:hypothetical protein